MKKITISIILILFLFLGGFLFWKARNSKVLPSQAEIGNNFDPKILDSFKGVIPSEQDIIYSNENKAPASQTDIPENKLIKNVENNEGNGNKEFSFAILGDTQSFDAANPNGNFQKVAKKISEKNPDLVIAVGDLVSTSDNYTEYSRKFSEWKKIVSPFLSKTYAAMGNHDNVEQKGERAWQDAFNFPTNGPVDHAEMTYSFDFKNSHFVILDSDKPDGHQVDKEQRTWLDQDLAKNKKENTFVIFHEPAFPVSSKIGESLDTQVSQRNALWQILDKYNVTAIFNGHEHIVSRRKIDSSVFPDAKNLIYQFVFGSTDSFNHDLPHPGVAEYADQEQGEFGIVKVNGKEITVETHDSDGNLLNSFTFSK